MDRRKGTGVMIFVLSIGGFFLYAYLLMLSEWSPIIQQLSMLMIVGGILGVVAWIGYVTATTRAISATITSGGGSGGGDNDVVATTVAAAEIEAAAEEEKKNKEKDSGAGTDKGESPPAA